MNYSRILPIGRILFLFLFASFKIKGLFLFLFVQKLASRIYSYSYSREKLLFADHWFTFFLTLFYKCSCIVIIYLKWYINNCFKQAFLINGRTDRIKVFYITDSVGVKYSWLCKLFALILQSVLWIPFLRNFWLIFV